MGSSSIQDYLKERSATVDRALDGYLKETKGVPNTLSRAMHYAVFSGGKRIRPVLTLATGELFGGKENLLIPFACALELIHTYSLVHDDLPALDDDDMRRGELASHKIFGEGIALLAGDALLTEAFNLMTRPEVVGSLDARLILDLIHEISNAAGVGGMVGGQAVDLEAEGREVNIAQVEYIHVRKTGALILTSVRTGAKIAGAEPEDLRRISRFGEFLGLAFQITDDILDAEGHGAGVNGGKSRDKERKKATYPGVVGLAAAKDRVSEILQQCLKEIEPFGDKAKSIREIAQYVVGRAV